MKKIAKRRYQRLPGKKHGLYRRARLWLGDDHLLLVDSNTYQETYQRYYFKDIQGITIRKTAKGKIFNAVVGALAFLTCLQLLISWAGSDPVWLWFWGIASGFLLLILMVNMVSGPTCACHIQTPISTNELPSLHRLGTARKVRDRIRTLAEQVQGRISREQIQQTPPPLRSPLPYAGEIKSNAGRQKNRGTILTTGVANYSGWAHWTMMAFNLLLAGFLTLYLFINGPAMAGAGLLIGGILLVVIIIALAKQANSSLPTTVKAVSWSVMAFIFIIGSGVYFAMLITMIRDGLIEPMFSQWALFISMSQIKPMDVPFLAGILIIGTIGLGVAALFGTVALISWQRSAARVHNPATAAGRP